MSIRWMKLLKKCTIIGIGQKCVAYNRNRLIGHVMTDHETESRRPIRVLFFNYEYPPLGGGAGVACAAILREYALRDDVEVDAVVSSMDGEYHLETIGANVRVHKLSIGKNPTNVTLQSRMDLIRYSWAAWRFASRLIRKERYTLSHSFFTVPCGFLSLLFRYRHGLPYIVSLRGSDVPGYSERFAYLYHVIRPLAVFIWRRARAVIANSRGLRDLALQSDSEQDIGVIYNGIDTEKFSPGPSDLRDNATFTVLCASRLSHRKGFRYAVEAFAQVVKRHPEARLFMAGGEGDAEQDLRQQVADLGISGQTTFFGYIPNSEFPKYYRAADVFVFPSLNEGMSNSMLEAMASGLPVIMTPTGGADELIEDGGNGFIVPFRESAPIAQRLEDLASDPELRRRLGAKSRERAIQMSWRNVAESYIREYEKIAENS